MYKRKRLITSIISIILSVACLFPRPVALEAFATIAEDNKSGDLEITVLALPQGGDCTIICYDDCQILVDSGEDTKDNWALIKQSISDVLSKTEDCVWDYVFFTHPDSDHIGNSGAVFNLLSKGNDDALSIGTIIDYDFEGDSTGYFSDGAVKYRKDRTSYCESNKCSYFSAASLSEATPKQEFSLGPNCTLSVLYNYYDNLANHTKNNTNNISVCFIIEYFDQKILFTGDLEQAGENKLMSFHRNDLENVTFFKAGHHGSKTSNTEDFINMIRPCYVAITSEAKSHLSDDGLNSFLRFTDYIFPSYVEYQGSDYKLFGTTKYVFNQESVEVVSESNSSANTIRDAIITVAGKDVNWYTEKVNDNELTDTLSVYAFDEGKVSYSNCSLIKYGHLDILIDCGSTNASSIDFVDTLKSYVVDGTLEYVIVTHYHTANISQLVGSNSNGVFYQFKVETLIDSSVSNLPANSVNGFYSKYLEDTSSNPNVKTNIRLKAKEKRELTVIPNVLTFSLLAGSLNASGDEDDCSMSTMIIFRDTKILFVGDLTDFSNLSKKVDISNVCYYRASNSAISYSDADLKTNYIDALKDMRAQYAVIGSATGYRMPNGVLFGSGQYKAFLTNYCSNVYGTGEVNSLNEYCPINGHLLFLVKYKPISTELEMLSVQDGIIRNAERLR